MFLKIVQLQNEELDRLLGGGIPFPSFILIQGEYGSGKTIFLSQILNGLLKSDYLITYFSTQTTAKEYLTKMKQLGLDFVNAFIRKHLYFITIHVREGKWSEASIKILLNFLRDTIDRLKSSYNVFVVDSIDIFIEYSKEVDLIEFLTFCKTQVPLGKSFILTMSKEVGEELSSELKKQSDVYFILSNRDLGGKAVKLLQVVKMNGAIEPYQNQIALEIEPNFGLRVVPYSLTGV